VTRHRLASIVDHREATQSKCVIDGPVEERTDRKPGPGLHGLDAPATRFKPLPYPRADRVAAFGAGGQPGSAGVQEGAVDDERDVAAWCQRVAGLGVRHEAPLDAAGVE
jgi:hypothetical protein